MERNQPRPEDDFIATPQPITSNNDAPEGRAPVTTSPHPTAESKQLALAVATAADSKKAADVVILEITNTLGIADYFVICTASSRKHARVVGEHCRSVAIDLGAVARPLSGGQEGSWVCGDFGDVILHVFIEETRRYYDLESLHADAVKLEFTPVSPTADGFRLPADSPA